MYPVPLGILSILTRRQGDILQQLQVTDYGARPPISFRNLHTYEVWLPMPRGSVNARARLHQLNDSYSCQLKRLCIGAAEGSGDLCHFALRQVPEHCSQWDWVTKNTIRSLTLHGFPLHDLHGVLTSAISFSDLTSLVLWNCTEIGDFLTELATSVRQDNLHLEHLAIMIDKDDDLITSALGSLLGSCKQLQSLYLQWAIFSLI